VPQTALWEIATYDLKPPLNRVDGREHRVVQGGQVPEFHVVPNLALLQAAGVTILDLVNAIQARTWSTRPASMRQPSAGPGPGRRAGARRGGARPAGGQDHAGGRARARGRRGNVEPGHHARLHHGHRQRKAAVLLNIARQPSSNTVAVADAVAAQAMGAQQEAAAPA
jgi:multidrug efflux pump subunit AcrB